MGVRLDQYTLATTETFRGLVEAAVVSKAISVLTDVNAPEQHKGLARTVLMGEAGGSGTYINQFIWAATTVPSIITASKTGGVQNIPDASVDGVVDQAWDIIAG